MGLTRKWLYTNHHHHHHPIINMHILVKAILVLFKRRTSFIAQWETSLHYLKYWSKDAKTGFLGLHTPVAETRINLWAFVERIIKIGSTFKNYNPKALPSSKCNLSLLLDTNIFWRLFFEPILCFIRLAYFFYNSTKI